MKNLLYVAIDVDDNSYNVGCYCPESSWSTHFRGKPEGAALVKELRKLQKKNYHIKHATKLPTSAIPCTDIWKTKASQVWSSPRL